jgi:hypothetical protein
MSREGEHGDRHHHDRPRRAGGLIPPRGARRTSRRELLARAGRAGLGLAAAAPLAGWLAGCSPTTSTGGASSDEGEPSAPLDVTVVKRRTRLNAEFPGALWVASLNFGFPDQGDPGRMHFPIRYLILHGTGWPETLDGYIAAGENAPGVHYTVGKDGRIVQFVQEADASWGNGRVEPGAEGYWSEWLTLDPAAMTSTASGVVDPNLTTISIEHEKYAKDNSDLLTAAQQEASFRLIVYLVKKYNIPAKRADGMDGGITGHFSMEPISRQYCPGPYPWDEMFAYLHAQVPAPPPTTPAPTPAPPAWNSKGMSP